MKKKNKGKCGRPEEKKMPERIPDTPENIMRALVTTPPKGEDEWRYMEQRRPS